MNVVEATTRRPRHRFSPLARRLAREAGVNLDDVIGTGPGGRVTRADITSAARGRRAASPPEPPPTPAHAMCVVEVDVSGLTQRRPPGSASLTVHLVHAVVRAMRADPAWAGLIDHIGVVIPATTGVTVSVIPDVGDLSVAGLARRITELTERFRAGDDLTDGSAAAVSIADLADTGMLFATSVLMPGQAAALSAGAVVERAMVVVSSDRGRAIAIRDVVHLALTYDPAVVDSASAAPFMARVKAGLESEQPDGEL